VCVCKCMVFVSLQELRLNCNFILISSENGGGVIGHPYYSFLRGVKAGDCLAKCPRHCLTRHVTQLERRRGSHQKFKPKQSIVDADITQLAQEKSNRCGHNYLPCDIHSMPKLRVTISISKQVGHRRFDPSLSQSSPFPT
jgi:hypothetical protein